MHLNKVDTSIVESLIRAGSIPEAIQWLKSLNFKHIPRDQLDEIANITRRVGCFHLGLNLLQPIIRPERSSSVSASATPEELATYAALLIKIGSADEALEILNQKSGSANHLLYSAFAHISRWDYDLATPLLKAYLEISNLDPYKRAIGQLNLASALAVTGKRKEALHLITDLIPRLRTNRWTLLIGGAFEVAGRLHLEEGDYDQAAHMLNQARASVSKDSNLYHFVEKWLVILYVKKNGWSRRSSEKLFRVKQNALLRAHFETVRECEYYEGLFRLDESILNKVYCGTPYPSYRAMILESAPWLTLRHSYFLEDSRKDGRIFDLAAGEEITGKARLSIGQKAHRLLASLMKDIYRPSPIGQLARDIFPDEYFHPIYTPKKTHEVARRLNSWAKINQIDLRVRSKQLSFDLNRDCMAWILPSHASKDAFVQRLERRFGAGQFSAAQVAQVMQRSRRSAHLFLKRSVADGKIGKMGTGRATTYYFLERKT